MIADQFSIKFLFLATFPKKMPAKGTRSVYLYTTDSPNLKRFFQNVVGFSTTTNVLDNNINTGVAVSGTLTQTNRLSSVWLRI